ncbi:hypothetical protein QTJ16_000498 [Diplocarpon rosae]|uniref:Non-ribosomal peptide synthetase n=1 Tax=Diplocarpon rosae TaxID=946125 RepID=A0AAD9T444_9HELO|nr:hypothetical protein QTJ16_000498 [Diplocarpon rosae]
MSTPLSQPDSLEKTHLYYVSSISGVSTPSSSVTAVSQGTTPSSSVTLLPLTAPKREPSKTGDFDRAASRSRWILFQLWFNTYRRFFVFVTLLNLVGISMTIAGHFPYAENHLGALVLGNLLAAIMVRNELFLRFLYFIAIYGLRAWAPLWLKYTVVSILQHVGGIHSGCALSAVAWLVYKVVVIIIHHSVQHYSVIATGVITILFVSTALLSAFPWIRKSSRKDAELSLTLNSIFLPWFTVRKVPVEVEIPSSKVAVLRFERGMQQGLLGRIGRGSIMEYHAFGIISEGRKSPYHYMICGVQGDFTKNLVANPPKSVWTRQLKFAGPGHASAMFKRGIRICTGTGLGAALSTCIQNPNWFLIWIGSNQEKTFGPTISALIRNNIEPERMILWDSKERGGRPDTMKLLRDTWHSFGAEVIFITSNMQGNDEMMQGCRAEGMRAFGTLWDF